MADVGRTRADKVEDLIAWQKARDLTQAIYQTTSVGSFAKDFGLRDQVRRAAVSVMSNLAEGFERGSRSEFHQFLSIAKSSCAELRSQLYVALDVTPPESINFSPVDASSGRSRANYRRSAKGRIYTTITDSHFYDEGEIRETSVLSPD